MSRVLRCKCALVVEGRKAGSEQSLSNRVIPSTCIARCRFSGEEKRGRGERGSGGEFGSERKL